MKKIILFFLSLILTSCAVQNSKNYNLQKRTYLDVTGTEISAEEFDAHRDTNKETAVWNYIAPDTGHVSRTVKPLYSPLLVNYPALKKKIEELTGKTYSENVTFLLHYTYKDDLCSTLSSNNWNKRKIRQKKSYTSKAKNAIEGKYEDLIALNFFEEGINLQNQPTLPEEYYYQDSKNFLKNKIFNTPSLCGSHALLKPNGELLVRNGEYLSENMAQHLKPQNWKLFFPEEN